MLGWAMPRNVLDLCIEFRQLMNGVVEKHRPRDLLHALRHFGMPSIEAVEKEDWQNLILTGGPYSLEQRAGILRYCMSDVKATELLLGAMQEKMPRDLERVLYRGRYTVPVAATQVLGVAIDSETWNRLLEHRTAIRDSVIADAVDCPVYEGSVFRLDLFSAWLEKLGLLRKWPRRARSTRVAVDDETFRNFSWHPQIERLRQIRQVVQQLRKPSFSVTAGRNYFGILPFKAESSRNATVGCIFQSPSWLRALVRPEPGRGLVYADYEQQEFAIAGVLSGDRAMLAAYESGDPYLHFGVMAGLIPRGGTKAEYPAERTLAKTALLAIQYGMKPASLAVRLGVSLHSAEDLLTAYKRGYRKYSSWSDQTVTAARWNGRIETVCKWRLAVNGRTKENTLRNFKVQGAGAEVLRLASILMWEAGIKVVAPVHDALLAECAESDLKDVAHTMQRLMARASELLFSESSGLARDLLKLRTEVRLVRYPDRLLESRGLAMWNQIQAIENRLSRAA
jgi:hypothetical protein